MKINEKINRSFKWNGTFFINDKGVHRTMCTWVSITGLLKRGNCWDNGKH